MVHLDYIIVGQGIAGTMLTYFLLEREKKVLVVDEFDPLSSSNVSAGALNPVTGRKCSLTWRADDIFPLAKKVYHSMEKKWNERFYTPLDIIKIFGDTKMSNDWLACLGDDKVGEYIREIKTEEFEDYDGVLNMDHGGLMILKGGCVDVKHLLSTFRSDLRHLGILIEEKFHFNDLKVERDEVRYGNWTAGKVIFCEGHHAAENPYFDYLPYALTKGELLKIKCPELPQSKIISANQNLLPVGDHEFLLGATYDWDNVNLQPTEEAKTTLLKKLDKWLLAPYEVLDHRAGIRPTIKDRRPLLGLHRDKIPVGIFNGMGSKGTTLAPYFGRHFVDYLEGKDGLDLEVDISRFDLK